MGSAALILVAFVALMGTLLLFGWFTGLERRGRGEVVVATVLGVALLEAVLFQSQNTVPSGLFRIPLGSFDVRPVDVLIPMALAARVLARPPGSRISFTALLWVAFVVWYAAGGITGYYGGNPVPEVIGQVRSMLLFGGAYALVAGTDVRKLLGEKFLRVVSRLLFAIALGYIAMIMLVGPTSVGAGPVTIPELGGLGADTSSIISAMGLMLILVEISSPVHHRFRIVAGSLAMLIPLIGDQAASIVGLVVMIGLTMLTSLTPRWRERVTVTPTEFLLVVVLSLTVGLVGLTAAGRTEDITSGVEDALVGNAQDSTSRLRVLLWEDARDFILESPVIGHGAGFRQILPDQWPAPPSLVASHNILLDVTLRSGLVGLALFLAAMFSSFREVLTSWRSRLDPRLTMLSLGAGIGIGGILAKGMVESVFDKFRLAVFLGALLSMISGIARQAETAEWSPTGDWVPPVLEERIDATLRIGPDRR
ncbi:MAG TPA: O-antigen ligase domain-containing protein [Acidimicrobiales bacterium]|nr:O-antigen ligase domain-containing protein [Acidimicrobiales bacterium]